MVSATGYFTILNIKYKENIVLNIVGEGPERKNILSQMERLKINNIRLIGVIDKKYLQKEYLKSDILVLTSERESFATVIIEAFASGVPVVSTNIVAVRNVITNNKNGLLVDSDPVKIAKAIIRLIENTSLRKRLITNAFTSMKKYSNESISNKIKSILEDI